MGKKLEFPADPKDEGRTLDGKVNKKKSKKYPDYRRQEKPEAIIKKAVHNRDLEDLLWGLIALSCQELRDTDNFQTLSAHHVISLIDQLNKTNKNKPVSDSSEEVKAANEWLSIAK
jgi:hypothetical protein